MQQKLILLILIQNKIINYSYIKKKKIFEWHFKFYLKFNLLLNKYHLKTKKRKETIC